MIRKFEQINELGILPKRASQASAGYDFFIAQDITIPKKEIETIYTYIKVKMPKDEFLALHIRSSAAIKRKLLLVNQVGIIDSDYYNNEDNGGHIQIVIYNASDEDVFLTRGERIAQGIFLKYMLVDDDEVENKRSGGLGSSNK